MLAEKRIPTLSKINGGVKIGFDFAPDCLLNCKFAGVV